MRLAIAEPDDQSGRASPAPRERARADHTRGLRVGLVLGAGGILGGAWLVGALHAIASETGWDPRGADYIVGTSAGSMVGALLGCGVPPWSLVAHSAGQTFEGLTETDGEPPDRFEATTYRLDLGGLPVGPGSWRLALGSLARPHRYSPTAALAGWLPRGVISTEPLKDLVRSACPTGWAPHPQFWAASFDFTSGKRVVFGRPEAPRAELPDAVAASCAVPCFYRPVQIRGRSYVDGGVHSTSNLDLLCDEPVDLVIALNPMSSLHLRPARSVGERLALAFRQAAGRRLVTEAQKLAAAGIEVQLVQPTDQDVEAMGMNLMNNARRHEVVKTATSTMARFLHESPLGARLVELAPASPYEAWGPDRKPIAWSEFHAAASARWSEAEAA